MQDGKAHPNTMKSINTMKNTKITKNQNPDVCPQTPNTPPQADFKEIMAENRRRNEALKTVYDPIAGIGCYGEREERIIKGKTYYLPKTMLENHKINKYTPLNKVEKLRIKYDFEFWCARCVTIKDKTSARNIKFTLNAPQRRVLACLEDMRTAGEPIRLILLKARQWGGSTLVQIYMSWIQIVHCTNWNSLICGHLKDTSSAIKGIYTRLLREYPESLSDEPMTFRPFERSRNVSEITSRSCLVATGSAESQESIRGFDISMAHLTEVSFWRNSTQKSPENVVRAVCGSIALLPLTVIVMESTANGVGNYFHTEWLRAKAGQSDKTPVFVPWYEIEIYRSKVRNAQKLWNSLDEYELKLWEKGLTLEMIAWYHAKRKEYNCHTQMMSEYPTDDIEAFTNTGNNVFSLSDIERLREHCHQPQWTGELEGKGREGKAALANLRFTKTPNGKLQIWRKPAAIPSGRSNRYIITVDVGGISDSADYSVISVIDRHSPMKKPEVVAQWRGHTYHDLLAWKAAQLAKWYHNGLLVIESNTLETEFTEGDGSNYILDLVNDVYTNFYWREPSASAPEKARKLGFHTNRRTKEQVIYSQMRVLRDNLYIEHEAQALDEYSCYEKQPNGSYGAMKGRHDDILMTRCIGLFVAQEEAKKDSRRQSTRTLKRQ